VEPIPAASQVVTERFPGCRAAFLSRGVLTSWRTPTSDLDIVVVLDGPPAPYRETIRSLGWIVEIFVHSRESLRTFYNLDAASRTCTLAAMCADGHVVVGDVDEVAEIQEEARAVVGAGPAALSDEERERWRYALTDLLDDFRGSSDPVETVFIASRLLQESADLALVSQRRWTGTGKWLARHLDAMPGGLAKRLADSFQAVLATGGKELMVAAVSTILDDAGGPLREGFIARRPLV
jgi:hypothetical protein